MKLAELNTLLQGAGLPVAYGCFKKKQVPALPYLVFVRTGSWAEGSDDGNELRRDAYDIELYSALKDPISEEKLEAVLDAAGIHYQCIETYIDSEEMYQCVYEIEFYTKK